MAFQVHKIIRPCLLCVAVGHCELVAGSTATLVNPDF